MNKIETSIHETEELIRFFEKEKKYLIVQTSAYENMLQRLENILRDNLIPNEENKVLNSKP